MEIEYVELRLKAARAKARAHEALAEMHAALSDAALLEDGVTVPIQLSTARVHNSQAQSEIVAVRFVRMSEVDAWQRVFDREMCRIASLIASVTAAPTEA